MELYEWFYLELHHSVMFSRRVSTPPMAYYHDFRPFLITNFKSKFEICSDHDFLKKEFNSLFTTN